jgi:BirA family transcriptional regulator, biotin operon repressor / biotin---[acetyl-CoA-carboxylase] ligase
VSQDLWRVEELDEVDSTNTYLAVRAREGADEGLVIRTDFQSVGRGRLDRVWEAPKGTALLVSFLFRPNSDVTPQLVVAAVALAARTAVQKVTDIAVDVKWPNDLLVGGKKLAGILAEYVPEPSPAVIVGLGLNLTESPGEESTNVREISGKTLTAPQLLDHILEVLHGVRHLLDSEKGREELRQRYASGLVTLGHEVRVEQPSGDLIGVATDVTVQGELVVEVNQQQHVIRVGDITHVRQLDT